MFVLILGRGEVGKAAELIVRIENPPSSGTIVFVLFDSASAFGDFRDPVKLVKHRLDGREACRIENITHGEYALPTLKLTSRSRQVLSGSHRG